MDDDEDYFTPTSTTSNRLAMLFNPEEMSSSSIMGHHTDPSTQFRFVAPKQPRPGRSNSSASTSSGTSQAISRDGKEVLLEVVLNLLPQGAERNAVPKIQVNCQVVGNAVRRSFNLMIVHEKGELLRAAVDSHLLLEVVERSILRVTAHSKSLTLLGEAQRIEALVMQLAIYRAVASSGPTQQDLCLGKGHVLDEGDVAKVSCITYAITSTALKGKKVEDLKSVKVTVSPAKDGGWESCLVGATAETHRLIFIPKQMEGKWLPPTTFHDVMVMKVRTKGAKEKLAPGSGIQAAPVGGVVNDNSPAKLLQQQQQQIATSHDASAAASPQSFTGQNGDLAEHQGHDTQEEGGAARKAALVSRMAQVGTPLFPLLPSPSIKTTADSKEAPAEEMSVPASTPSTAITSSSTILTSDITSTNVPTSVTSSTSTSGSTTVLSTTTTTTPVPVPSLPVLHHQAPSLALDPTLALSVCQLGTSVAKISDKVDLLLAKVDRVETSIPRDSSSSYTSDPEALMALAHGLVAHNERLRADVESLERKLVETQTSCTSLLAMNAELLEEKREMLQREAELRKEEEDTKEENNKEDFKNDKEEPVKEDEEENQKEGKADENQSEAEDTHGLTPEQVRSLLKSTLSGLFHHLSATFSEEEQYTRPQILQTVRSGLETAYSSLLENLEEMAGVEEGAGAVVEEGGGEKKQDEEKEKEMEEENGKSHPQVEVKHGKSYPGEEICGDFATEENWKENEMEEEHKQQSEVQNNTFEIESLNLIEKDSCEDDQKEEENLKKSASLCLDEAQQKPDEDQ